VLHQTQVSIHDDFFELGGDSISASQIIMRVRANLSPDIPLRVIFEQKTVAKLAQSLQEISPRTEQHDTTLINRTTRNQLLPLSYAQERLWFLHQLHITQSVYNEPSAYALRGNLNVEALTVAINKIVEQHEILRTCFPLENDRPVQKIVSTLTCHIPVEDLRTIPIQQREETVQIRLLEESHQPFTFEQPPLFRVKLFWLD